MTGLSEPSAGPREFDRPGAGAARSAQTKPDCYHAPLECKKP